jgi:hypothetical protein
MKDNLARIVFIVGVPLAHILDPYIESKKKYLDKIKDKSREINRCKYF